MYITNVGFNQWHDADFFIDRPAGSGDHLMLLLKSDALFVFAGGERLVSEGSAVLYRKGTPQLYRAKGSRFGNDWFHFLPDNAEDERLLEALDLPFDTPVKPGSISELSMLVDMMCREHYSTDIYRADSTDLLLKLFFFKLSEKLHRSGGVGGGTNYEKMSLLRSKIYNDPALGWNIEGLSHELAMSQSSFQHTYKKLFGVTPMNDVIAARIERAKYLLSSTGHTIKQIAHMCGYSSDTHFVRQFGECTGKRPSEYRAEFFK